ncbi:response regulator [Aporhodopirellula aestuarii]|uniref:histidine kinase n=1 Tax=Aporhodopirellula aestuarii TaxID=2950107 RepID=A0ABT0U9M0_9BACT|nr:response regulator [Aporhodopirellula aestuarii]MCM2373678.1 response regulator [Aporhodopirellula aestuarii]
MAKKAFQIRLPDSTSPLQSDVATIRVDSQAAADRDDLETLSLVASRAGNAILIMDASGTIEWTNDAFTKLSGYDPADAIGHRLDDLVFGPSTDAKTRKMIAASLSRGEELTIDVLQYRKDGSTVWAECQWIPVNDDTGTLSRWIVIESDITRRRQTEEALLKAKRSAEANSRSKSEFLANMSHEIRTPLNAILGMTELALTTDLSREQRDYIQTVKTSADALLELLNDVLDISRIEAGKMEIEEVDFNLADVVRETTKALAVRAHEKGLELAVHMPMTLPQELRGDSTRIRQVLFNLIGNAVKFTEEGEVVVSIEEQWRTDTEVCMQFSVSDTGIGIPADRLKKIFDAFTQVDSSMARRFGGSGLGLTITSQLVRLMEGKLWVQSSEGKGSTFHFTLTMKMAADRSAANVAGSPSKTSREAEDSHSKAKQELTGYRVLIVDDNATNRRILNEMLSHWGLVTTLCDGAATALKELESATRNNTPFDLVILDAMMPVVDGFQLAQMIQQRPDLKPGTVMMLSSADRPSSTSKCEQLGIKTYLVKPVSASALLEAIYSTLETPQSPDSDSESSSLSDNPFTPAEKPLRILVVDDHQPNRKLVESILHRRGHHVRSECDGDAAASACKEETFDAILMDVQMPGRDGFSATEEIRASEKNSGRHTPIIALTAHALQGDRERCLAAGMDSYLAKPLHAADLLELVEQIGRGHVLQASEPPTKTDLQRNEAFNIESALRRMGGELDLLKEHIGYVLNDMPQLMRMMTVAIEEGDAKQLQIAAHRMKSLVSSYDHEEACELAQQIELDAKLERLPDAASRIEALRPLVQSFARAVDDYLQAN